MTRNKSFILGLLIVSYCMVAQAQVVDSLRRNLPNIIYFYVDDLGYGDLGVYGQKKIETPNIDALANDGMIFTQHYAHAICSPSRFMLLTGYHPGHSYIRGNDEWEERGPVWDYNEMEKNPFLEGQHPFPDSITTIAEVLKSVGYHTGIVGKWGLGGPFTESAPNKKGFDFFYGFYCQRQDHTYYPGHIWKNEMRVPLNNKIISPKFLTLPKDRDPYDPKSYNEYQQIDYAPDFLVKEALDFIKRNVKGENSPFFLFYPSPLPHNSLQARQKWVDYYHNKFGEEEPYLGVNSLGGYYPVRYPRASYAAMVSTLDENIGLIIKLLKELDIYKNTILFFTSDNGPAYNGGADPEWRNAGGPLPAGKGRGKSFLYEGGIRIPHIVTWPGKIKPGSKSNLISAVWDALPTISQIVDAPITKTVDGISYLPTLLGREKDQKLHSYLYWEYNGMGGQQAIRFGKWKAIRKGLKQGNNVSIELYNLETDIREEKDLSKERPEIVKKLTRFMELEHTTPQVESFKMKTLDH